MDEQCGARSLVQRSTDQRKKKEGRSRARHWQQQLWNRSQQSCSHELNNLPPSRSQACIYKRTYVSLSSFFCGPLSPLILLMTLIWLISITNGLFQKGKHTYLTYSCHFPPLSLHIKVIYLLYIILYIL